MTSPWFYFNASLVMPVLRPIANIRSTSLALTIAGDLASIFAEKNIISLASIVYELFCSAVERSKAVDS